MILTGNEIERQVKIGTITLSPFSKNHVNPNSYNYRLGHTLKEIRQSSPLNPRSKNDADELLIPHTGLILRPGRFYLAHTYEEIGSTKFVPILIGRSSIGRLGLFLQISADLGNLGACHRWTLELYSVLPIRVYPKMIIGQVSFWSVSGAKIPYEGTIGFQNDPIFAPPLEVN
ncbi:MAG: hypothetical protein ABJN34_13890 [Litoreibacter sp.]|uniref:dCTP deaminase n=1 Tax=Litoreibacter sp. TaxID=1969459 RepID=UPI003296812C